MSGRPLFQPDEIVEAIWGVPRLNAGEEIVVIGESYRIEAAIGRPATRIVRVRSVGHGGPGRWISARAFAPKQAGGG